MFKNSEYLEDNYWLLRKISLAYELIEDEEVEIDNMIDAIIESKIFLTHIYGFEI